MAGKGRVGKTGVERRVRRNNRPKGEFFLFPATWRRNPSPPFVRLSRQKYAKPCAPTVEKLGRLIGQSPQPYLDDEGTQPRLQYAKKKKGKKKEKKRWGGRKKIWITSRRNSRMCEYERMTVRQSGMVEKELTARSKSEFLDEGGSSSTSVATVVRLPLAWVRGSKAQLRLIKLRAWNME